MIADCAACKTAALPQPRVIETFLLAAVNSQWRRRFGLITKQREKLGITQ